MYDVLVVLVSNNNNTIIITHEYMSQYMSLLVLIHELPSLVLV